MFENKIRIPEGNTIHFVDASDLRYIRADGSYVKLIGYDKTKIFRISLRELSEILPDQFIRVNKSTIINKDFIRNIKKYKNYIKVIIDPNTDINATGTYKNSLSNYFDTVKN